MDNTEEIIKTKKDGGNRLEDIDPQIVRQYMEQEKTNRLRACREEIQHILEKYDCELQASPRLTNDGRISAEVIILPKE